MSTSETLWAAVAEQLRQQLNEAVWLSTFAGVTTTSRHDPSGATHVHLEVPSVIARDRINNRYHAMVQDAFEEVCGPSTTFDVVVQINDAPEFAIAAADLVAAAPRLEAVDGIGDGDTSLNPHVLGGGSPIIDADGPTINNRYTFERFVTGSSNRFAHAAALAVAETPSRSYNPLFIHGHAGLGKTHLLQAIAHYVTENYPSYRVCYVTTETLLSEFVDAIRSSTTTEFKRRYRENDVLLIDDIQFLEGKDALQEELFHTFNTLHQADRQIVLSSDRPPDAIPTLEDRLRSRFKMGLITDIQPPDIETRLAILRTRTENDRISIEDDILEFIASNITNNIRELEGALIRATAYAQLTNEPLTLDVAKKVLSDLVNEPEPRTITPQMILESSAAHFGFPIEELIGASRRRPLVSARQIAMYVMRELTDMSYPAIAREFGGRDHTTVIHSVEKVKKLIAERRQVYDQVTELIQAIKSGRSAA
ncbi:MAG: chromosomal replication initiator protein DnaA [Actinomycetota bacterium]